jgi:predicted glycoside hydrolase/deacetylase ChbG (UPF0249 family)
MNTSERLGYGKEDRLLIVNADDLGLCPGVNAAVEELLADQAVTSATLMMPCGWSADAIRRLARLPNADIGVHWTLTSEWPLYRWGPIARNRQIASLVGKDGWFPLTIAETERKADPDEVRTELIAQTEAALQAGVALTHADNHMGSLYGFETGRDMLSIAFEVCVKYACPSGFRASLCRSEDGRFLRKSWTGQR